MKVFLLILFLVSCSFAPTFKDQTHGELADYVIRESLLDAALVSSVGASSNCLKPFETNMDKSDFAGLMGLLQKNFKYNELRDSIKAQLIKGTELEKLRGFAEKLNSPVWNKFLLGIVATMESGSGEYNKLKKSLDDGSFDLGSSRAHLVASITEEDFTKNLVTISNTQLLKMFSIDTTKQLTQKQQGIVDWVKKELNAFYERHIKHLFLNTYISTLKLSEEELQDLLKIRNHDVMKLEKLALEQELNQRYHAFFKEIMNQ